MQALRDTVFIAPEDRSVNHGIAPGAIRRLGEASSYQHLAVEGQPGILDLLAYGCPHLLSVVVHTHGGVGDQGRDETAGPFGPCLHRWQRYISQVRSRANPANRAVSLLAASYSPETLAAVRQSGGLSEAITLPILLCIPAVALGATAAIVARLLSTVTSCRS